MDKKFPVSKNHVLGAVAMWAVRQSPYDVPDELETVLWKLSSEMDATDLFEKEGFSKGWGELTYYGVRELLDQKLKGIPEFMAWNERKNGNQSEYKFTSRYDGPENPDDDFIDLDALIRNVANTIIREDSERSIPDILGESPIVAKED